LITGAGVRYPLRREMIDPSHLPARRQDVDGRPSWAAPDDALVEQAIAHAAIWSMTDAERWRLANLDPPF